ncbi:hypothetical protein EOL73_00385 [Candidatus Saccharibacteria bacterium]|nr:hypothetical protein [Candidatus Saccharibacteria bacterium]NCU40199.1 hypothetical protein [Candidatus Saccharibacteria bacterium]
MMKRAQPKDTVDKKDDLVSSKAVLDDIYDNMYRKRKLIYAVNFVRGIFFGIGSAIGGTVVIAVLLWVLSWLVDWPLVGDLIKSLNS